MNETKSLTVIPKLNLATIVTNADNRIAAISDLGTMMAKSGFFGFDNVAAGQVAVATCLELGIGFHEYNRTFDCIKGKPRKKAMAALAEFEQLGGEFEFKATGDEPATKPEDRKAVLYVKTKAGKTITYTYSMADAAAEGLVKADSRWIKRPGQMLRARATSNALGIVCPSIYAGEFDEEVDAVPREIKIQTATVNADAGAGAAGAAATSPEKAKAIDVEVVTEKPTSATEGKPEEKAAAPANAAATPPPAPVELPKLPQATVDKLEKAIGEHAPKAGAWFIKEGWLQPGQGMEFLTQVRADKILTKTASFIRAVTSSKPTEGSKA